MRRIDIPEEAYLLHGLRFSGYLETLTAVLANGYTIVGVSNNTIYRRPQITADLALEKDYYQIFTDFYELGGDLALSEPSELWDLLSRVEEFYDQNDLRHHVDEIEKWNKTWKLLVDYRYFTNNMAPELTLVSKGSGPVWRVSCNGKKSYGWSSREFVKSLNVAVCPYCNINPLPMDTIRKDHKFYHMHPDMDHYFNKGRYPFLALNIYNFIPACDICNRRIKGVREIDYSIMAHPYVDDVHKQVVVKADEEVIDNPYMCNANDKWLIKESRCDIAKASRGLAWFDFFGIMDLSRSIKNKTRILTSIINATAKESLHRVYSKQFGGAMPEDQFQKLSYGCSLDPDNINKWPLSKITIDLVSQVEKRKKLGRDVCS